MATNIFFVKTTNIVKVPVVLKKIKKSQISLFKLKLKRNSHI